MKKTGMILLAAFLFLAAAGWLSHPLLERRQALRPASQTDLRHATPMVAFVSVALGGFRGILADFLWLRIASLQDEGRYFEITQLSDWITKLEPTFTEVWSFHAWNMAYNIGFMFDEPADRWRWVENALTMLRDGALRYNPDDPRLCFEVGWLFFNKIGGFADEAAGYYQMRLYQAVESVLPGGWRKDDSRDDLLASQFRLDGAVIGRLEAALGPLDWRLPESHAAYWAWVGREKNTGKPDLPTTRLLYQSMIGSCLRGRIVFVPERHVKVRLVRLDLMLPTLRLMESVRRVFPDDEGILSAEDFLLRTAIFEFYAHGADEAARPLLETYRGLHPNVTDQLAAFAMGQATGDTMVMGGYLEQLEGLFFEAETQRRQGHAAVSERLDSLAALSFQGLARMVGKTGETLPLTLDQLRERGRVQAQALLPEGGKGD